MSDRVPYWRLDFPDGDFKLIFPSQIPLTRHSAVRAYHLELLKVVQGLNVWPPPPDEPDEDSWDIYPHFPLYYRKIMSLIDDGNLCSLLLPSSRHLFFICTEPAERQDQTVLGLSGLEQLMGFSLPEEKPKTEEATPTEDMPTTGDSVLDVKVDIYLVFKGRATRLIEEHSLDELCRMAKQAGDRMQQARKEDEKDKEKEIKEAEDDDWFNDKKAMLLNRLKSMKIAVPSNF